MANTTVNYVLFFANRINISVNIFCAPVLTLNISLLTVLSIVWLVCIYKELMRRNKKLKSREIRNTQEENEVLNNHNSYKVRDWFLLIICLCEAVLLPIIIIYGLLSFSAHKHYRNYNYSSLSDIIKPHKITVYVNSFEQTFYLSLFHMGLRISRALVITTLYVPLILVRILTQFLVRKYSFYKYHFNLKPKLGSSLCFLFVLFICGLIRVFLAPFYIIIGFAILFEYLFLVRVTIQLRRLLKQRLTDALNNENVSICVYYKTVNGNYKYFSIVLLLSLFFLCTAHFIFCIHSVVVTILVLPNNWFSFILYRHEILDIDRQMDSHPNVQAYNLFICCVYQIFLTIGLSLQMVPYLFVSLLKIVRSIRKIRRRSSINAMLIHKLIEKHNNEYGQKQ